MEAGSLVSVLKRSHWGGIKHCKDSGLLLRRTYLAYDNQNSLWLVLVGGETIVIKERNLRVV